MILTADSVADMTDQQLIERYIACVLAGDEESDFAVAARADLIANRLMTADDLDAEIDRALDERLRDLRDAEEEMRRMGGRVY